MQVSRRAVLRDGAAVGLGMSASMLLGRQAKAADDVAVGSILDATGPINIYGLPMIDATTQAIAKATRIGSVLRSAHTSVRHSSRCTAPV